MAKKREVEVTSAHFVMDQKVEPEQIPEELLDSQGDYIPIYG